MKCLSFSIPILCQRRIGAPVTRYHRSGVPEGTAEHGPWGILFPLGHWPRPPVLLASPPTDMLRRLSCTGFPAPGGSVVRPATVENFTGANWTPFDYATLPRSPLSQGPARSRLCDVVSSPLSIIFSMQYLYQVSFPSSCVIRCISRSVVVTPKCDLIERVSRT